MQSLRSFKWISPESGDVVNAVVADVLQVYQSESAHFPDPKNCREAMRSPDNELWERDQQDDLKSLRRNITWRLVKMDP